MNETPFKNAYWIWDDGDPKPVNGYRVFRKTVVNDGEDYISTTAFISAQSAYALYINGMLESNGPAPSAKGFVSYDEVIVQLAPGENPIDVVVYSLGIPIFSQIDNPAGFVFEMDSYVSDTTWTVSGDTPWCQSTRWSNYLGFNEVQNTEISIHESGPDEESILPFPGQAKQIAPQGNCPFGTLISRGTNIPARDITYAGFDHHNMSDGTTPGRLIGYGNCESIPSDDIAGRLQSESLKTLSSGSLHQLPEMMGNFDLIDLSCAGEDLWLLFDMGREMSGLFRIYIRPDDDVDDDEGYFGKEVDIGYSEILDSSVSPSGLIHGGARESFRYADRLFLASGESEFTSFASRAFRYVRLVFRNVNAKFSIYDVGVAETTYPVQNRGVFTCSDPRLDKIWEVGRRTLQLCMGDTYMDCPQRERAQYIADTRIQAIGAQYCFGESALTKRFLIQTALGQHEDGSIDPCGPGEWSATNPNAPIPGFMAIYVQAALDYYMNTGDGETIIEIMPAIQKALGWLASYGGAEGGLLTSIAGWNFTDWAPGLSNWNAGFKAREPGIAAAVNLFYLEALRAASYLAELAGDEAAAISNRTRATMVAGAFDSLFWSVHRGVYVDSVVDGVQGSVASQQVNSLALLSKVGSDVRKELILESLFGDKELTQIGSPYFSFYLVQALALYGEQQTALDYIREKWGAMLDAGATSWWETWDGTKSRCHAWSIAPTIWLTEQVLGITPYEPGFACVSVAPKLCDLKWARGMVPIPQGDVQVAWTKTDSQITLDITAPTGVHIRPVLPCGPTDLLIVDGEPIAPDSIIVRSETSAEIAVLPGSGYRFEVVKRS